MKNHKIIYLDHAATTPLDAQVFKAMRPFLTDEFGNPSSLYSLGRQAKGAVEKARQKIAGILNCRPEEIIFEGSGTESINHALIGAAYANRGKGQHIITSVIEHHAVLHACQFLETQGFEVTYLPVDQYGLVKLQELKNSLREDTILISIMYANNEIGTIQSIEEIKKIINHRPEADQPLKPQAYQSLAESEENNKIIFHTDACQAPGQLELDVQKLGVDLLSLNGSKIYGPKGIGLLYLKQGVMVNSLIHGGTQEMGRRAGTENVANIMGLAEALDLAAKNQAKESERILNLRNKLLNELLKIDKVYLNGQLEKRLPNNINMIVEGVESGRLIEELDKENIAVSAGSACTSGSLEPSHVIMALGRSLEQAKCSLRLSLGRGNTEKEVDKAVKIIFDVVRKCREA